MGSHESRNLSEHKNSHPFVSESHEGNPVFEWAVGVIVVISGVVAWLGYHMAATVIISVAAMFCAVLRLILRERSPWKVRSVAFDTFIGIALGLGLLITYFSIRLLL
ncbi:DUF3017 domain-containing protein [Bifidobacterium crudilactis]|jgi:hypothetical protein|uniref:DUF3017 domain-containing protein n=1 Tax=Bifidobacterium crudilactis TaxID=327277 RepID=UPI001EE6663A|nr:DUF3017 domain-containing protein [Bifidobacterium crudilactis]MCI1867865.1 DUF3017 domain-containing protein [Bifidobacterium crudilactis]MCI2148368.1 DUF3017 domain-containing protein [Bifidobacterium crudilactis]MCI2157548.1 DUF3017 domain-containing protein [Bifidobacterium crudilactis]MDN5972251.1 DUF3017 domain-containing protein [Bifidobacterium crudilactis]MDN6001735.1 DUF3017 domain-containing protein [Bifidobacterium crudilactis]